jgi:hypothetical protein
MISVEYFQQETEVTKTTKPAVLMAVVMLLAACGGGQGGAESTSTVAPETTMGDAAATTTTAVPDPTTTTAPSTTTTAVGATPEGDAASLFASLQDGAAVTSARMEGSIEMSGLDPTETGVSEATILFSTSFDTATGDSSFVMDMSSMMGDLTEETDDAFGGLAAGMLGEMEVREIGEVVYLKYPLFTAMFGAETEWVSMPAEEGEDFTADFETMPTDPTELIDSFDAAGATVETVGTESVNGVDATHYRLSLDISQMEMTPEEEAELAESGIWAEGVIPMELWVSDAGFMVRMIMEIDGPGMDVPAEESFESMSMRYDLFDINGDITIEAPPVADVTSLEDLEGMFDLEG